MLNFKPTGQARDVTKDEEPENQYIEVKILEDSTEGISTHKIYYKHLRNQQGQKNLKHFEDYSMEAEACKSD